MKIAILGLGWLGLPLSIALNQEGHEVFGSVTSDSKIRDLKKINSKVSKILLTEKGPIGDLKAFFNQKDILIINIPPGLRRNPNANFVAKIENIIPYIKRSKIKHVLFVSSTSVFANKKEFPLITSQTIPDADSIAGKQLARVEALLVQCMSFQTTILRFAGLYGPDRHPATMLSKRTDIKNPNAPVNLIHLNDCIGVIKKIIITNSWGHIYNASYPDHPAKENYYSEICKKLSIPTPDYNFTTPSKGKIIDSSYLVKILSYTFEKTLFNV